MGNNNVLQCPPIDKALLDYLSSLFPDRCPSPTIADRQVWIDTGSALVVRHLQSHFDEQNETVLTPSPR